MIKRADRDIIAVGWVLLTYRTASIPWVAMMVVVVVVNVPVMVMVIAASTAPAPVLLLVSLVGGGAIGHHVQVLVITIGTITATATIVAHSTASRVAIETLHQPIGTGTPSPTVTPTSGEPGRLVGHHAIAHRIVVAVVVMAVVLVVVQSVAVGARHCAPRWHGSSVRHPSIVGVHSSGALGSSRFRTNIGLLLLDCQRVCVAGRQKQWPNSGVPLGWVIYAAEDKGGGRGVAGGRFIILCIFSRQHFGRESRGSRSTAITDNESQSASFRWFS